MTNPPLREVSGKAGVVILWGSCLMNLIIYLYAREQRKRGLLL